MISAPVLILSKENLHYTVTTNASDIALGAVLSQNQGKGDQPIAFESRKLSPAEKNYPVHKKELLAIIHALKVWRVYLEGTTFTVETDHASLEYLKIQKTLSRRQVGWLETLQAYDYNVKYCLGKMNVVADALSRILQVNATTTLEIPQDVLERIREGYPEDSYFGPILEELKKEGNPGMRSRVARFKLDDGLIYFIQDPDTPRLCIPKVKHIRLHILHDHHYAQIAGHLGIDKTYAGVTRSYFWPKLTQEVYRYVTSCDACQRNKSSNRQPAGLLQPLDLPGQRWEQVSMDFIVQLPKTKKNGFDAILVVVDRLTKRIHLIPTYTTVTASDTARIFFDGIFRLHSLPKTIVSDRDSKFISKF